jgi:hypothetical protein
MIGEDWQLIDRHRAEIKAQAENEPVFFRHLISEGYAAVLELIDGLTNEQATFRPSHDARCITEIVQHIAAIKRWAAGVSSALARGATPEGGPGASLAGEDASLTAARLELEGAHERMLDFADSLWPMTDLTTCWALEPGPAMNCKEWGVWQRLHDRHHAEEIAAIQADGGYPFTRQAPTKFRKIA